MSFSNVDDAQKIFDLRDLAKARLPKWLFEFVDRGTEDGLENGNRLRIVRRGDAAPRRGKRSHAGNDDRQFPDADRGDLIVVEAGTRTAIALTIDTVGEIEIGDHALMRPGD